MATASVIAAGSSAHAGLTSPFPIVPVPDAVVYTFDNTDVPTSPCSSSNGGCPIGPGGMLVGGAAGFGYAAAANGGDPSIGAMGVGGYVAPGPGVIGNGIQPNGGVVQLDYDYSVSGPADTFVPVTITGSLATNATGDYASIAYIDYGNGGLDTLGIGAGALTIETAASEPSISAPAAANLDTTYDVLTNTPLRIVLDASAQVVEKDGVGQGAAQADPRLSLSSASLAAGEFITLSPNIAGGVPEPSTWAMMLVGLGALGAAMRGSRRRVQPPRGFVPAGGPTHGVDGRSGLTALRRGIDWRLI